ncbi:MAG: hypothetical protein IGS39_11430 [Calothrix sp. C42_A2020_038]|nr:hypothetical protein [Calothrix sp. C42_A2020_038]
MTPSRYQSRLFNFFSRQSQRLGDSIGRTWRSCQVAANWSLEVLFYPVFILIEKIVDSKVQKLNPQYVSQRKNLTQSSETTLAPPVPSDTAIVHVLEIVKKLPSRSAKSLNPTGERLDYVKYHQQLEINDTLKPCLPEVRGIATHLGNKHIVLVTADNKILDILTLKQQQMLQDRIIAEMAEYRRLWHLSIREQVEKLSPEIDRLLNKITGRKAIPQVSIGKPEAKTESYLFSLDATVARIESSLSIVRQQAQHTLDVFFKKDSNQPNQDQNQSLALKIRALVHLAINHFFGASTANHFAASHRREKQKITSALPKPRITIDEADDLWLTFDDLFGEELQVENQLTSKNTQLITSQENQKLLNQYINGEQLATSAKFSQTSAENSLFMRMYNSLTEITSPLTGSLATTGVSLRQAISGMFYVQCKTTTQNYNQSIVASQQVKSDILISNRVADQLNIKQNHQIPEVENKPEFIEIRATTVKYEKHILERVLEWLDNLMLWLEDKLVIILKLIQQIFA